jgi:hypothetical protein
VGMRPRELLRCDELPDFADAQVVSLYIHLVFPGVTGRLAKKNRQCRRFLGICACFE